MIPPFMLGVATRAQKAGEEDFRLMRDAGIRWLRFGEFGFDILTFLRNEPQGAAFNQAKTAVANLREAGFQMMGLTPGPYKIPPEAGIPGSDEYYQNYGKICAFLAYEFRGLIDWWQIGNELDIWLFRGTLDLQQCIEFLTAGIRAMKSTAPDLKLGINITLFPSLPTEVDGNTELHEGVTIAEGIYGNRDLHLDYAGFDSYPGTWRKGGPESWHAYLDDFHRLTKKPVLIQEFGYSSAGGLMSEDEIRKKKYPCHVGKWKHAWRGAHTQEIQADFVRESLRIFAEKPFVLGATYYNWRDGRKCWQCKSTDCPIETNWGLLDRDGKPKPSYYAFKTAAKRLAPAATR